MRITRLEEMEHGEQEMFRRKGGTKRACHAIVRMNPRRHQSDRVHVSSLDAAFSCIDAIHAAHKTRVLMLLAVGCELCCLGAHHFSGSSPRGAGVLNVVSSRTRR